MSSSRMRVRPTALIGIGLVAVYLLVVVVIQATSGIPYTEWVDSSANLWRGATLSVLVGGLVVAGVAVGLGWFRAALTDTHRSTARWTLLSPILYLLVIVGTLATTQWSRVSLGFLVSALVFGAAVGFAEELVSRGLLVVGLRGTFREVWVWLLSCLLFGAMHGINIVLGQSVGVTGLQILSAAVQGSALYLLRRVTGSLLPAMALHALWDFAVTVNVHSGAGPTLITVIGWIAGLLAVVGGFVVARQTDREPREDYARG